MGGITASLVARRCGARVVYVAAFLPRAGAALKDLLGEMVCPEVPGALVRRDGLDFWRDPEKFGLDPAALRGQALAPYFDVLEDPVPGTYVACARDRVVSPAYQRSVADVELDCGHLPQVECPERLAALL
jgi:pimeloyl-ACP methyl ester carboxylesterase